MERALQTKTSVDKQDLETAQTDHAQAIKARDEALKRLAEEKDEVSRLKSRIKKLTDSDKRSQEAMHAANRTKASLTSMIWLIPD